jgi:Bacterial Ig-like domain (group 2)
MRTSSLLSLVIVTAAASLGCQSDATAPLIVDADPVGLTVVPGTATVDGGRPLRLTARLRLPDGSTATTTEATWSSTDGTIATVGQDGIVEGVRAGQVQIVATWHDSRGSSLVTVIGRASKDKEPPRCIEQIKPKAGVPTDGTCV